LNSLLALRIDAKEERKSQVKTIVDAINTVSENIGDLVKEIRKDRRERTKSPNNEEVADE
jgi:hypothetical protein